MGRPKGARNKASLRRQRDVEASGITPLEYMLRVMRDPRARTERRDWAAAQAAPYVHPRLATLQSNVNLTGRLTLEALVSESLKLAEAAANDAVPEMIDVTPKDAAE